MHSVSPWDLYIDPNALVIEDAEWTIERHRMTRKQLRELKSGPSFRADTIDKVISRGANYTTKSFENIVREDESIVNNSRLWEVLEYWGYMSTEEAMAAGLAVMKAKRRRGSASGVMKRDYVTFG